MNPSLEKYLDTVSRQLKPLPISERIDIVKEIKGGMLEMEQNGISAQQILDRLGSPKELAKAYLADLLIKEPHFSFSHILTVCAFYSMVGFSGLFIIPVLGILAPTLLLFGILSPLAGAVKLVDNLLNLNLAFAQHIGFTFGSVVLGPVSTFFASIGAGIVMFLLGYGAWKLLVFYCRKIGKTKRHLAV